MTPAVAEVVVNTTDKTLHVGDGLTAGGEKLATEAYVDAAMGGGGGGGGLPSAITGSLSSGSSVTLTVDFTTYAAYDVYTMDVSASGPFDLNVSSDGGSTYATTTVLGGPGSGYIAATGTNVQLVGRLYQLSAIGATIFEGVSGNTAGGTQYAIIQRHDTSSAVNRVRFITSGAYSAGSVRLQPSSPR